MEITVTRKGTYKRYRSPEWANRTTLYLERHPAERCDACLSSTQRKFLRHRNFRHWGAERDVDLFVICPTCWGSLKQIWKHATKTKTPIDNVLTERFIARRRSPRPKRQRNKKPSGPGGAKGGQHRSSGAKRRREEYHSYITSPAWRARRLRHLALEPKCVACDADTHLHVHHLTYTRLGDELDSDLMTLCEQCHSMVHKLHKKRRGTSLLVTTNAYVASRRTNPTE